jgi:LysR family transcriptional regulator, glycine cleavage system transcriptional activator
MAPFRFIIAFYHVATLQSVARASEELGVTPGAVSQQLRVLEEQLGTKLVTKAGRRIRLTESGERYFEMIASDIENIIAATRQIQGERATMLLTVRATPTISTKWLLPRLGRFLDANPAIDLRLDGSNEPTDFSRDLVDLEIRHGIGRWPGLHVVPLAEEAFLPVCSPDVAAARSIDAGALKAMRLIHSVKAQVQWSDWFDKAGEPVEGRWRMLHFDRSHMAIDAAAAGLGIALESTLMMERELESGQLVVPVARTPRITLSTQWLVCPPQHLRRRRVRLFIDWLRAEADAWQRQQEETIAQVT